MLKCTLQKNNNNTNNNNNSNNKIKHNTNKTLFLRNITQEIFHLSFNLYSKPVAVKNKNK